MLALLGSITAFTQRRMQQKHWPFEATQHTLSQIPAINAGDALSLKTIWECSERNRVQPGTIPLNINTSDN